jgi:Domain of unknown function (DUF4399)
MQLENYFAFLKEITMTTSLFRTLASSFAVTALVLSITGCASTMAPSQALSILEPANNATVPTTFKVRFGVKGMDVAPAGEIVPNSGHHHLLINLDAVPAGESVPFSDKHMHFGKGQTETDVTLPPGVYKLTAQFANGAHQSYGKPMSQSITVTVK